MRRDGDQLSGTHELQDAGTSQERFFTVLYIEDNVANERLMEEVLSKRPSVRLLSAALGRLGIDLARQHLPDLILLDLHLEDISGEDVLREVVSDAELVNIPVVIVSADATPGSVTRLLNDGAYRYMTKPVDVQAVLDMIDELRSR
jgi:CheY-like chemotaxis protein